MKPTTDHINTSPTTVDAIPAHNSDSTNNEIFHTTHIEGTPFAIIEYPSEVFLALGRFKIKRQHDDGRDFSADHYRQLVLTRDWHLLLDIFSFFIEQSKK